MKDTRKSQKINHRVARETSKLAGIVKGRTNGSIKTMQRRRNRAIKKIENREKTDHWR